MTPEEYTTCACCGVRGSLARKKQLYTCLVCNTRSEPAPSPEQIEEAKREIKLRAMMREYSS
jgi:hypothetical protein